MRPFRQAGAGMKGKTASRNERISADIENAPTGLEVACRANRRQRASQRTRLNYARPHHRRCSPATQPNIHTIFAFRNTDFAQRRSRNRERGLSQPTALANTASRATASNLHPAVLRLETGRRSGSYGSAGKLRSDKSARRAKIPMYCLQENGCPADLPHRNGSSVASPHRDRPGWPVA